MQIQSGIELALYVTKGLTNGGRTPIPGVVFIGRPSQWGNPISLHQVQDCPYCKQRKQHSREEALICYDKYLQQQTADPEWCAELDELQQHAVNGCLRLDCFCHPQACHGHLLRDFLQERWRLG